MRRRKIGSGNSMLGEIIDYYDKVAETYDQQYASAEWKIRDILTNDYLQPYLPKKERVLNAGAGTGRSTAMLLSNKNQNRMICLDASKKMLGTLRRRHTSLLREGRVLLVLGNVLRLPFKDEVFGFIFLQALPLRVPVFGDLPLRELVRVLKTGSHMAAIVGTIGNSAIAKLLEQATRSIEKGERPRVGLEGIATYLKEGRVGWEMSFYQYYSLKTEQLEELCTKNGLTVVQTIGSPMLVHLLPEKTVEFLFSDPETRGRMLDLEETLSRERSMIGNAGRLEIIARKANGPGIQTKKD